MALFKPNLDCTVRRKAGTNAYGEESLGDPIPARCAIVRMNRTAEQSTVRADSSASRGAAREFIGAAQVLFLPTDLVADDQVEILGNLLRVKSVEPRLDIRGRLDHIEVNLVAWGKK